MTDHKPPRVCGTELETLLSLLQYQRDSLIRKLDGLDETVARQSPVPSGTSLLWLLKHLAQAEIRWFLIRFDGQNTALPDDTVHPQDTVASVIANYRAASARADTVVRVASLDELGRGEESAETVNLRWVLAHLLEETARHAGHADIVRELIDGSTGR